MLLRIMLIPVVILATLGTIGLLRSPIVLGVGAFMAMTLTRALTQKQDRSQDSAPARIRALIIGAGNLGQALAGRLEAGGLYHVVGFVDDPSDSEDEIVVDAGRLLGRRYEAAALVRRHAIDEVLVAHAPTWQHRLTEQLAAESPEVAIRVIPTYYESMMQMRDVEHVGDIALVRLQTTPKRSIDVTKRIFDVIVSAAGLLMLAPLMLVVALLVKLTSRGPAVFAQERIGRYGKPFMIYKFRTMQQDAEVCTGPVLSEGAGDTRLTSIGRWLRLFRIDEIPQLWNVLRNEMSLVGPRPERTCFVRKFEETIPSYSRRHQVRPGITGLAQVCGGYHTNAQDKLRFDLIYVSHHSIWYDLSILLRTVLVVLLPRSKGSGGSVASRTVI